MRKKQNMYQAFIYILSFLFLGILFIYPLVSHEEGINTTNSGTSPYQPRILDNNIQCKRVVIDPTKTATYKFRYANPNNALAQCDEGYVPVGVNTGTLLSGTNANTSHDWLRETISEWGGALNASFWFEPLYYKYGDEAINKVQMICVPRQIVFQDGPCTQ